jgi:hypothetical protein
MGNRRRAPITLLVASHLVLLASCDPTLPPLRGQMEIGQDPYAVFVGGRGPNSDLYGIRPDGGKPVAITFTSVAERRPALSPDGGALAFLRGASLRDSTPATIWVMNLLSGSERETVLPAGAGRPIRVGWATDGASLIVATAAGLYRIRAPPAAPASQTIGADERAAAESSLAVLVGDPVFGRVHQCDQDSRSLCVSGDSGTALLARNARDAVRWGKDSVAFLVGNALEIRPLGRGRPRRLVWTNPPEHPREITFFEGRDR